MNFVSRRVVGLIELARPYVRRYGLWSGIRIALGARRAQWATTPGPLVRLRVPGLRFPFVVRAATSDMAVFDQVIVNRELRGLTTRCPRTIIDAGANIGASAVEFANMWPAARIVCLEVNPDNLAVLRMNVASYENITVLPCGLWSHMARLSIINQHAEAYAFIVRETDDGLVEAKGVLDVVAAVGFHHIDLLKMDIEGSEVEVLGTSHAWIHLVDQLVVELHDRLRPGCRDAFERAMHDHPFTVTQSGEYTVATRHKPRTEP